MPRAKKLEVDEGLEELKDQLLKEAIDKLDDVVPEEEEIVVELIVEEVPRVL